jgi:hypothetical protein
VTARFRAVSIAKASARQATLVVALLGASFQTHSWPSTITVLIPSAALLVVASRQPSVPVDRDPALTRGLVLWAVLIGATLAWEAFAFVQQPDWSRPSHDYPTMSTLLDPVLEHGPLRILGWLVWLGIGARLVAR